MVDGQPVIWSLEVTIRLGKSKSQLLILRSCCYFWLLKESYCIQWYALCFCSFNHVEFIQGLQKQTSFGHGHFESWRQGNLRVGPHMRRASLHGERPSSWFEWQSLWGALWRSSPSALNVAPGSTASAPAEATLAWYLCSKCKVDKR